MGSIFTKETTVFSQSFSVPPGQYFEVHNIRTVIKELEDCSQNIMKIEIGNNTYDEEALSLFADTIQECQNITTVDFSSVLSSQLQTDHLEILNSTLLCLHSIYEVDLSHNFLTEETIDILSFLFHSDRLKVIKVNDNLLGVEGAMKLSEAFRNSDLELFVFCADRNFLEDQGVSELSEAFTKMKSLRYVSLSENKIGKEGVIVLCKSLKENLDLQAFDLNYSYINEEAAYNALGEMIENLEFLSRISLNDCFLCNAGATCLMGSLNKSNGYLRELHLAYNEIDKDEVGDAISMLLRNRKLLEVMIN